MMDGRSARKVRSRATMLLAGVTLATDGNWRPTVGDIAAKAGVSKRTFFQIFGSTDDYYKELLSTHGASLRDLALNVINADPEGLTAAIHTMVAGRVVPEWLS